MDSVCPRDPNSVRNIYGYNLEIIKMKNNRRKLTLEPVNADGDNLYFKITEQTHRGREFAAAGDIFISKKGIEIYSAAYPDYCVLNRRFYVRGKSGSRDDDLIEIPFPYLQDVLEAVAEYNETNGGFGSVFPQVGDTYYYIGKQGRIGSYTYSDDCIDERLIKFSNFFRTEELAETALEKIRELLKTMPKTEVKK